MPLVDKHTKPLQTDFDTHRLHKNCARTVVDEELEYGHVYRSARRRRKLQGGNVTCVVGAAVGGETPKPSLSGPSYFTEGAEVRRSLVGFRR